MNHLDLFEPHLHYLYRVGYRVTKPHPDAKRHPDAEEFTAEAICHAWERFLTREVAADNLRAWLASVVANRIRDQMTRSNWQQDRAVVLDDSHVVIDDPAAKMIHDESLAELLDATGSDRPWAEAVIDGTPKAERRERFGRDCYTTTRLRKNLPKKFRISAKNLMVKTS